LASRELQEGDLLLEKSGGGPNSPVGRVGYFHQESVKTVCSNFMQLMRPNPEIVLPKYLFYFLDGFHSNGGTIPMQTATTNIRNIKMPQFMAISVPFPPLPEQHKIVEILEDHLSRLDAALADVKQAKVKAAQFRRSLLQAAFTGNLRSDETRLMTELPDGWQNRRLEDVADWTSGGTPSSKDSSLYGGEIPWVVIGDLTESKVFKTEKTITLKGLESSSAKILPKGTVMLAMYGASIGRTGIMDRDMSTNQAIACGIPDPEKISTNFLLLYLQSQKQEFIFAGKGGAQPNISQGVVKAWKIPLPPLPEQHKIVEILEDHLSRLDASIALADAMEKQSAGLRRSLLQAAFTGQLTKEVASV
jgi:restriction endonuclease S subunit